MQRNSLQSGKVDSITYGVQGTGVNLEAENEGMLGSGQQATIMQGLPPERLALNRKPLEDKVSRTVFPAEARCRVKIWHSTTQPPCCSQVSSSSPLIKTIAFPEKPPLHTIGRETKRPKL